MKATVKTSHNPQRDAIEQAGMVYVQGVGYHLPGSPVFHSTVEAAYASMCTHKGADFDTCACESACAVCLEIDCRCCCPVCGQPDCDCSDDD